VGVRVCVCVGGGGGCLEVTAHAHATEVLSNLRDGVCRVSARRVQRNRNRATEGWWQRGDVVSVCGREIVVTDSLALLLCPISAQWKRAMRLCVRVGA
jgi:hypothetical protein